MVERKAIGIGVVAAAAGAFLLLKGKGAAAAPAPGTFDGFSLAVENAPPGTVYWIADFPFIDYPGKIDFRSISEGGYFPPPAPGAASLRIILLDADFNCVDPTCERIFDSLLFEDGFHYVIDLATGETRNNPNPPPLEDEPSGQPEVQNISIPSVISGENFTISASIFLPDLRGDNQGWTFELRPLKGRLRLQEPLSAQFLATALIELSGEVGQMFIPLNRSNNLYPLSLDSIARYWPNSFTTAPLPPGSYPLKAIARSIHYFWVTGPTGGLASSSVETFDLGDAGILEVV